MYAIVTGLAYDVIKKTAENLKVIDVEQTAAAAAAAAATAEGHAEGAAAAGDAAAAGPGQYAAAADHSDGDGAAIPPVAPPVMAPPAPPAPPPPRKTVSAQSAKGDLRTLFTADDYPASAAAAGAEGTAQAQLRLTRAAAWSAATSSARPATARSISATCNILRRRAKFTPARDSNGNPTTDTVTTPPIRWQLEG